MAGLIELIVPEHLVARAFSFPSSDLAPSKWLASYGNVPSSQTLLPQKVT
jgi:hypothetical protein